MKKKISIGEIRIIDLDETDINGLNAFPPGDWQFDYEEFLIQYFHENYFHAFIMFKDDKIVGTGNVLVKEKIGWLANIIIDKRYRSQGLGSKMTDFLVNFLMGNGCETQLLIATELGEQIYRKSGFRKVTDYRCYDSVESFSVEKSNSIRGLKETDLIDLLKLDQLANGENRKHLIDKYYKTGIGYFTDANELLGFYLPDFGRGLVISKDEKAGCELLKLKHSEEGKRTLLPSDNKVGIALLENLGLKEGYKCSRMILGRKNQWNPNFIYSYGSGYCG